jgi:transcription-repair coupling factor (superfamily II helicase)
VTDEGVAKVLAELSKQQSCIHVARNDTRVEGLKSALAFFAPELEVLVFPAWDCLPYDRISPSAGVTSERIKTLSSLATRKSDAPLVVLTTVNALIQKVQPRETLSENVFAASTGDSIAREDLQRFLAHNGYYHVGTAAEPGEFAARGSILDIMPAAAEKGFRLDFFGDEIETIKLFDPLTQISNEKIESILLTPASEIYLNDDTATRFRENYRELFGAVSTDDPLYEAVTERRHYAGVEHWLPLFYKQMHSIAEYLPKAAISFDHLAVEAWEERQTLIIDHYDNRQETRVQSLKTGVPYKPIPPELLYYDTAEIADIFTDHARLNMHPFAMPEASQSHDYGQKVSENLSILAKQKGESVFTLLTRLLGENEKKSVIIACYTEGSRERIKHLFDNNEIPCKVVDSLKAAYRSNVPALVLLPLEHGFSDAKSIILTEQDLFGDRIIRAAKKKSLSEKFLKEASGFNIGEVVVHKEHGIGRFEGLETLTVAEAQHDCLKLIYDGGDRLYLPVENIELLSRYGGNAETVQLDKLGGLGWQSRKARLKERIKITAEELLKVAASRVVRKADALLPPEGLFDEFCAQFPYTETEDQLQAIDDVVADMGSGRPMDRLVCGDVGFGKTEVAMRAAFLACQPGRAELGGQVAIVTPTTLLCRQHYQNFIKRFKDFPVKIRQLSRLVSNAEQARIKQEIADGEVDIVIGTHALLGKSIRFKKLSMLVVDEEQHFGVKQKESLKKLRAETHVLTLTATPIPRTLQMSLTGVRELSLITTPPVDRLAVRTYVMPFDPLIIREALLREHYRGGKSFYVCPRVGDLADVHKRIRELVPEVKIAVAHGQMAPNELDEIMNSFYDGSYDVLLSTTIVESGIDIPTANTMVIERADMFGLAQLYQLRGRVGRSKARAYAYLTLSPRKVPTKQAMKRLEVMQTLDTLGAGFTLASYDMDIRGFGNLLGDEQSGNIKEVGVELYQQMLEEAIETAKRAGEDKPEEESFSPQINLGTSVLIPESYVEDLSVRLSLYRRAADLQKSEEVDSMAAEMVDRFGPLPEEVKNLFDIVALKQICKECGISRVEAGPKGAVLAFHHTRAITPEKLLEYIQKNPIKVRVKPDESLVLAERKWEHLKARYEGVLTALKELSAMREDVS